MKGSTYVTTPVEGNTQVEEATTANREHGRPVPLMLLGGSDYYGDALLVSHRAIDAIEELHKSGLYGRTVADTAHTLLLIGLRAELAR